MWQVIHLIARPIEALLGVFCVLSAIVLYPDEEGKIQSKFEDFWIRVDDFQNLALSRHAAFMTQVAKVETRLLDRVFGQKLVSGQSLGISFSFSLGTLSTVGIFLVRYGDQDRPLPELYVLFVLFLVSSFFIGWASISFRTHLIARRIILAISFIALVASIAISGPKSLEGKENLIMLIVIVPIGGFAFDALFIVLTRRLLRWAEKMISFSAVLSVVTLNLLLALLLISPLLLPPVSSLGSVVLSQASLMGDCIALTNLFDAALALVFVLLSGILLIHRAVWPLLTRTLFRMADIGTKGRRAILSTVGFALIAAGISGKVPELMQKLIDKL